MVSQLAHLNKSQKSDIKKAMFKNEAGQHAMNQAAALLQTPGQDSAGDRKLLAARRLLFETRHPAVEAVEGGAPKITEMEMIRAMGKDDQAKIKVLYECILTATIPMLTTDNLREGGR